MSSVTLDPSSLEILSFWNLRFLGSNQIQRYQKVSKIEFRINQNIYNNKIGIYIF